MCVCVLQMCVSFLQKLVTDHTHLEASSSTDLVSHHSEGQKSSNDSISKAGPFWRLCWELGGESFSLLFPAPRGLPHSTACGLAHSDLYFHLSDSVFSCLSLVLTLLPCCYEDCHGDSGPPENPGDSPHLKVLIKCEIPFAK